MVTTAEKSPACEVSSAKRPQNWDYTHEDEEDIQCIAPAFNHFRVVRLTFIEQNTPEASIRAEFVAVVILDEIFELVGGGAAVTRAGVPAIVAEIVFVFPVPGGPNTMSGGEPGGSLSTAATVRSCSSSSAIARFTGTIASIWACATGPRT